MDAEILRAFIEECENHLPIVRGGILLCNQKEVFCRHELRNSLDLITRLKNHAGGAGLAEFEQTAGLLEQKLHANFQAAAPLSDAQAREFLDLIVELESAVSELKFGMEDFEFDAASLLEETFENFENDREKFSAKRIVTDELEKSGELEKSIEPPDEFDFQTEIFETSNEKPVGSIDSADSFEDFEIDDEMLEIFAMEAEDHLRGIGQNLEILEKDSNNREALLEIRRSAHTLKGSAGIVGLKQLSGLAHRVEDLLDFISDKQIESNEEIFNLLLASTDCLNDITSGKKSAELNDKLERLHQKFDGLFEKLEAPAEEAQKAEAARKIETARKAEKSAFAQSQTEVSPENSPPDEDVFEKQTEAETLVKNIDPAAEAAEQTQNPPASAQTRSVIRVSLEKLDDLVNLVSEMVFSRSVFEQRLFELEKQIKELQLTTSRLQRSTGKLETDFEFGMTGSPQGLAGFGIQPANSAPPHLPKNLDQAEFDMLEFDRYTDFHQTTRELVESTSDNFAINTELDTIYSFLELLFDNQKRLIDEMQDKLLNLRMVSFGTLSARLQRTVRVTAEEEEKLAQLSISGENIEVDTQILDLLVEPLLHLLRNAVAHGIETPETRRLLGKNEKGEISLKVYSEGTHIILTVSDDGRGISVATLKEKAVALGLISKEESRDLSEEEALSLIFLPGLTTAEKISQVAGRGVGMNVVKTSILRQQGTISVDSVPQKGTTFTMRMPMALAVTRSLLVKVGDQIFAFPLKLVKHVSDIAPATLARAKNEKSIRLGNVDYTVSHLNELLGLPLNEISQTAETPLLILDTLKKPCALIVDKIIKPEEIVIKPLGKPLKDLPDLLGATILGDGTVVPVLDLVYLINEQNHLKRKPKAHVPERESDQVNVMIVDDSPSVRYVTSRIISNNGWNPVVAKDGLEALDILHATNNPPNVILTDVEMPQMNGYELLATLKRNKNLRHIPVVMITSRASDKHRRKAFELGVSEYVTKPYEDSKLVEIINFWSTRKS